MQIPSEHYEEAPVIRLETDEQVARSREQIVALDGFEPGSVEDLLRIALIAAVEDFEARSVSEGNVRTDREVGSL